MIFVDANVFMYAVGRDHEFKQMSREFFDKSALDSTPKSCRSCFMLTCLSID